MTGLEPSKMAMPDPAASPKAPIHIDADTRLRLLVDEYKEANAYCRNQDLLTRTNNLVFIGFFAAMTGLLERSDDSMFDSIVFCALGILGSLLFAYVGLRSRSYYLVYLERAHEIEEVLGLDLLRRGDRKVKTYRLPVLKLRLNNPTVFLTIQIGALLYFLVRLIVIVG
jgi:hypothetical protein